MAVSCCPNVGNICEKDFKRDYELLKDGERAFLRGEFADACRHLYQFLEEVPDHLGALEILAKAQWQLANHIEVIRICDQMICLHPAEPGYQELKAMSLRAQGHYGACAKILEKVGAQRLLEDVEACQAHIVKTLIEHDSIFALEFRRDARTCFEKNGFYFANPLAATDWLLENTSKGSQVSRPRPSAH
jgi:tetratricopeptide (TPR) repeat protein